MASPSPSAPAPEALATTKRKFDNLLDRLTNPSTTSLAATLHSNVSTTSLDHSDPEHSSKRSRNLSEVLMDRSRDAAGGDRVAAIKERLLSPQKGPGTTRLTSTKSVRAVGMSRSPVTTVASPKPANYQPHSQEQFLERLKTFADVKMWTKKPEQITEVEWAKQGWSCVDWNVVGCKGGCEMRVAVKLRPKRKDKDGKDINFSEDMTEKLDNGLVEKFRELIVDGHHEDCLWRKRGCSSRPSGSFQLRTMLTFPDDIYHLPIASRAKSTADFLLRYRSLKAIAEDLPILDNIKYPEPSIEDMLKQVPSSFFQPPGSDITEERPSTPQEKVAFLFAIFGWHGKLEEKLPITICIHCHQRSGLWLYQDARLKEMAAKLQVPILHLRMDLVLLHREHCPWTNPETQRNPPDGPIANMSGWQTQEFMMMGSKKRRENERSQLHNRNVESVDLGSEYTYPRGSTDSRGEQVNDGDDKEESRWRRFKAKLRRTTSKKSLRSVKSVKSTKSTGEKE